MTYSIVYSSRTGNTRMLAEALREALPREDCIYFGEPDTKALEAETIYLGFWTDKGSCDESCAEFLKRVTTQKVFLFGTRRFWGSSRLLPADTRPGEGKPGAGSDSHRQLHVPGQNAHEREGTLHADGGQPPALRHAGQFRRRPSATRTGMTWPG